MNKLNIVPGFKEGGVASIMKAAEDVIVHKPNKQVMEECAKIAQKVPAETYRGLYMPMTKPKGYIQARHLSTEQMELLKKCKNEEEVESLLKSFKYYEKLSQDSKPRNLTLKNTKTGKTTVCTQEQIDQLWNAKGEEFNRLLEQFTS